MTDSQPRPSDDETPVTGPFAIRVTPAPGGVDLDVSDYLRHVLLEIAEAAAEDPEGLIDSLTELRDASQAAGAPGTEAARRRAAAVLAELTEDMTRRFASAGCIRVYGRQVLNLTERLWSLIRPKAVPQQRGESAGERGAA